MSVIEQIALRGEESKTYQTTPGKYQMVVGGGISHYRDVLGAWQDIDLTVENTPPAGFDHFYTRNKWRVAVDTVKGRILVLPYRNDDTRWILFRANPTQNVTVNVQVINNKAIRVYKNTANENYNFLISDRGIKTYIVLQNASSVTQWQMGFQLNNLQRVGYGIYDGPTYIGGLPNAWLEDANGVTRDVTETISGTTATLTWDVTGLAYPITVDPTLTVQPSTIDNWMDSGNPTINNGTASQLVLGKISAGRVGRTLIEWDMSSLPNGAVITSATATLVPISVSLTPPQTYRMERLSRTNWTETGSTWNTYDGTNNWTTAGGDVIATSPISDAIKNDTNINQPLDWDVTGIAQYWQTNGNLFHIRARALDETPVNRLTCASRENATTSYRPKLVINYTLPSGPGWQGDLSWVW